MKTREQHNSYHKIYQRDRYYRRKQQAFDLLGNQCTKCGSIENLEIDHIDPSTKAFNVSRLWGVSEQRWLAEISKCQLLCKPCHTLKSIYDLGHVPSAGRHGHTSMVRYCRPICDPCRLERNRLSRENKRKHRMDRKH